MTQVDISTAILADTPHKRSLRLQTVQLFIIQVNLIHCIFFLCEYATFLKGRELSVVPFKEQLRCRFKTGRSSLAGCMNKYLRQVRTEDLRYRVENTREMESPQVMLTFILMAKTHRPEFKTVCLFDLRGMTALLAFLTRWRGPEYVS